MTYKCKDYMPKYALSILLLCAAINAHINYSGFDCVKFYAYTGLAIFIIGVGSVWPIDKDGKYLSLDETRKLTDFPKKHPAIMMLSKISLYSVIAANLAVFIHLFMGKS